MKIKYSGLYGKTIINLPKHKIKYAFYRNKWRDIDDNHAKVILENPYFISEKDIFFDKNIFYKQGLTIGLYRSYALGDLVQLIPIVNYLKTISNNKYVLITTKRFIKTMKHFNVFHDVIETPNKKLDKIIYLDGILENDHNKNNKEHLMHRIKIYESFFGINIEKHDFSVYI